MPSLDRCLLDRLLPRLLSNSCPATVPRSGLAGEKINCFITTIHEAGEPNVVLLRRVNDQVEGLLFANGSYSTDVFTSIDQIDPRKVHVTHFYGVDEVRYEGIRAIAQGVWTGWPYALLRTRRLRNAIAQRLFNRRTLTARRRLEVLREVVEATVNGATSVDAMELMNSRYGYRWADHPEWKSHYEKLEKQFELLADAGDLQKSNFGYQPTGQALRTLEETEEADRRHTANYRVQVLLALLTFISAVMASAQAGLLKLPVLIDLRPEQQSECPCFVQAPQQSPAASAPALALLQATPNLSIETTSVGKPNDASHVKH